MNKRPCIMVGGMNKQGGYSEKGRGGGEQLGDQGPGGSFAERELSVNP